MKKLPWTHPIAARLEAHARPITYEEAAMYVRNQLRRYSVESVVSLALELLQHGEPQSGLDPFPRTHEGSWVQTRMGWGLG